MFHIHWILDDKKQGVRISLNAVTLPSLPRIGDEVRADATTIYEVKRVCWCLDETNKIGQRVNIAIEKIS